MRRNHSIIRNLKSSVAAVLLVAIINASPNLVTAQDGNTQSDVVLETTAALPLTGTFQTVSNLFGDQLDSHTDCELATYSSDNFFGSLEIRYFDFATNTTACFQLSSFISECQALSGKRLTPDQANQLINSATQIKTELGCLS